MVIKDNIKFNNEFTTRLHNLLGMSVDENLSGVLRGFKFNDVSNVSGNVTFKLSHGYCVINNIILEKEAESSYSFFSEYKDKYIYLKFIYSLSWGEPIGQLIYEDDLINSNTAILIGKYDNSTNTITESDRPIQTMVDAMFVNCETTFETDYNYLDHIQTITDIKQFPDSPPIARKTKLPHEQRLAINHPNCHIEIDKSILYVANENYDLEFIVNSYKFNTNGTRLSIDLKEQSEHTPTHINIVSFTHCITDTNEICFESNYTQRTGWTEGMELNGFPNVFTDGSKLYQLVYKLDFSTEITKDTLLTIDLSTMNEQYHPIKNPNGVMMGDDNKHWFEAFAGAGTEFIDFNQNYPIERIKVIPFYDKWYYSKFIETVSDSLNDYKHILKYVYPRTFVKDNTDLNYGNNIMISKVIAQINMINKQKGILWQR